MLFQIATLAALMPFAPSPSPSLLPSAAPVTIPVSQDRQSRAPASLNISIRPVSRGRLPNATMKRLTPSAASSLPLRYVDVLIEFQLLTVGIRRWGLRSPATPKPTMVEVGGRRWVAA
ncbi:hypothetical protein GQ457_04G025990 [Hibiscus cannabinus]